MIFEVYPEYFIREYYLLRTNPYMPRQLDSIFMACRRNFQSVVHFPNTTSVLCFRLQRDAKK